MSEIQNAKIKISTNGMTADEILQHRATLNRERQKRFYEKNKERLNEKRRQDTIILQKYKETEKEKETIPIEEPVSPIEVVIKKLKKPRKNPIDLEEVSQMLETLKDVGKIKTEGTLKKYLQDVKRLMTITKCDNINDCLKNPKKIKEDIESSSYALNTKKSLYQTIVYLIDNLNLNYSKKVFDEYKKEFDVYKIYSNEQTQSKTSDEQITFPEYLEKVKQEFGEMSKMYLLSKVYNELTARDDFQLEMVKTLEESNNPNKNYIVMSGNQYIIMLNKYKTSNKYGQIKCVLSKPLTTLLKKYIKTNKLTDGSYLFGETKNTQFVSTNNKLIGVESGINTFRHMKVTEEFKDKDLTTEQRVELARKLLHSPVIQLRYLRNQ